MEWALKIMANLLDDSERGTAERAYKVIEQLARFVPDSLAAAS
jgi:hypothetical protein